MPDADVFLCRFSADFTSVEAYVRITDTTACDQLPYAWIESGVQANVTIDSFTIEPQSVAPGGSCALSWSTSNATSVRIDNGVGDTDLPYQPEGVTAGGDERPLVRTEPAD